MRRHHPACHDLAAFGVAGRVHVKAEMQDFNGRVAELRKREPACLSVRVDSAVNVLRHADVLQPAMPSPAQQVHRPRASFCAHVGLEITP